MPNHYRISKNLIFLFCIITFLTLLPFIVLLYFVPFHINCFFYKKIKPDSIFCNTTSLSPLCGDRVREVNSFSFMVQPYSIGRY